MTAAPSGFGVLLWVITVLISIVLALVGVIGSAIILQQREHGRKLLEHGEQLAVLVSERVQRSNVAQLAHRRRHR